MCLITIANTKRPSIDDMEKAARANGDGMGVAWRHEGKIRFVKGMESVKGVHKLCSKIPMPFVIHYRWASIGGKGPQLCHPFPITAGVELTLKGEAEEVLFHNGHLSDWQKSVASLACARNEGIPEGKWSDTRGIAWIVARLGASFLEVTDGKWVFFSKSKCTMYGNGWDTVGKDEMYHSNTTWNWSASQHYAGYGGCGTTGKVTTVENGKVIKTDFNKKTDWEARKAKEKMEKIERRITTQREDWDWSKHEWMH